MNILVINCGSSSVKYQVINTEQQKPLIVGNITIGKDHQSALRQVLTTVEAELDVNSLSAVGHRIVHGGDQFRDAVVITDEIVSEIEKWIALAPLHNPANLAGIHACRTL